MKKLLVSACFLGEKVRYDGDDNLLDNNYFSQWKKDKRLIVICPEVTGGLSTPRDPAEIQHRYNSINVITISGENVTNAFEKGAQAALLLCQRHDITHALLKESSPSCGSHTIYDGSFKQRKIVGEGVTTKLLRKHGIKVYSEKALEALIKVFD
jgi:uncharacterized protein YbbK (DUF523 family)